MTGLRVNVRQGLELGLKVWVLGIELGLSIRIVLVGGHLDRELDIGDVIGIDGDCQFRSLRVLDVDVRVFACSGYG